MSGMNMFCACLTRRRSDQVEKLCKEQFERIRAVYPGTHYMCLLDNETGEIIAQTDVPALSTEELTRTIITLKRAAMQFAATMNQMDSQVVHIKGDERMFSCFGGERTILAFYTQMPAVQMEFFDCAEADKTVESVNVELNRIAYAPPSLRSSPPIRHY